jgi:UDP-glucuronate 4-epimerase
MAPFLFSDAISNGNKIKVFNGGKMQRDFTYVGDIVEGIVKLISVSCNSNYSIYNIGNSKPVQLLDFIKCLEEQFKTKALLEMCDMQPGDVVSTWADVKELNEATGYSPETNINDGVKLFIDWYKNYFNIK